MPKVYLQNASLVSVFDYSDNQKIYLGEVLVGVVAEDEKFRFRPFEQIVTSKVIKKLEIGGQLEIRTYNGSCYVIDYEPRCLDVSAEELRIMRAGQYSPERLEHLRRKHKY